MHSSHHNVLTVRVEELTAEEQRLLTLLSETRERLETVREDLVENRARLANVERYAGRPAGKPGRRPNVAAETFRRVIRELGTFTVSELASELDCNQQTAKRYLDAMLTTDPPVVVSAGRAMGKPIYEYRKPIEAGDAFTAQQRLRSVPDLDSVIGVGSEAQARNGEGPTGRWASDSLSEKVVRDAVNDAERRGWKLKKKGDGHYVLIKGAKRVGVAASPKNPEGAADIIRRMTREAMPAAS